MLKTLLTVYGHELADFTRICGKDRLADLNPEDLASLDQELARGTGLAFAGLG